MEKQRRPFKDNLQVLRKERKITQKELAKQLNVTQGAITNWETGRAEPSIEILIALSRILLISIDALLDNQKESNTFEEYLLQVCRQLNEEGQEKLMEQAEFFVSSDRYIKNAESDVS